MPQTERAHYAYLVATVAHNALEELAKAATTGWAEEVRAEVASVLAETIRKVVVLSDMAWFIVREELLDGPA